MARNHPTTLNFGSNGCIPPEGAKPVIRFVVMKIAPVIFGFLLVANALAQQPDQSVPAGVIFGIVLDQDGQPAKGLRLNAFPLGVPLGTVLPTTKTDLTGKYRFKDIPWWGRYTVYSEDDNAGYKNGITGPPVRLGQPAEITLSSQDPVAEFDFRLPPKAGFLRIRLTNRRTGAVILGVGVSATSQEDSGGLIFSESCSSDRVILLPPDKDLLIHIKSPGFLEWGESRGNGKPLRIASGSSLDMDVQLEPAY
jgi:hypothetical protein